MSPRFAGDTKSAGLFQFRAEGKFLIRPTSQFSPNISTPHFLGGNPRPQESGIDEKFRYAFRLGLIRTCVPSHYSVSGLPGPSPPKETS